MYQLNQQIPLGDLRNWMVAFAHLEQTWQAQKTGERSPILDRELNRLASLILATIPNPPESTILVLDSQGRQWGLYLDKDWEQFAPEYSLAITCYPCCDLVEITTAGEHQ